jgi:hypothetical protein
MNITERFIDGVLSALPEEGVEKLNKLLDDDSISEETLSELLKEYKIDPIEIIKKEKRRRMHYEYRGERA